MSVRSLYDRGLAAIGSGRPGEGARLLRAGLRALGPDDRTLEAHLLTSLAAAEVQLGQFRAGFDLLDRAEACASGAEAGLVRNQRGLLLMLVGRLDEALGYMNEAVPLLAALPDPAPLARGLLNRAMLHDLSGRIRLAMADLDACEQVARAGDLARIVAKVQLNRGHCFTVLGDIPAAVRSFDAARVGFAVHAPDLLPVVGVDKARALLVAGLATEAAAELDTALGLLVRPATHERAEAELVRADTALAAGEPLEARTWARRAERSFRRRGNGAWAELAVLTRLRAEFLAGMAGRAMLREACASAGRLSDLSLHADAEHASLLAANVCISLRRYAEAAEHLVARRVGRPTLETKLARRYVTARLLAEQGSIAPCFAQIRAGLGLLRRHRERFGSIDFQTGTAALGARLAGLGLATAVRHSAPPVVFTWLERSRAQAFRLRPVFPPADAETTDAVAELRRCAREAREAELSGRRDVALQQRCVELERRIRSLGWTARGDGEHTPAASFGDVADELGAELALISFVADGSRLCALVVVDRVARLVPVGDLEVVTEAVARLRSDLDALCGRRLQAALEQVVHRSVRNQVGLLSASLVAPVLPLVGDRELVVVPTGALSSLPWGLLPPLRGRPVTVAPSATRWLLSHRAGFAAGEPLLVAGPDLSHAGAEVAEIARIRACSVLSGASASVAGTLQAMDGRGLVHFTAHGHHEQDNVLFSRLDLVDGPLMAYDVHQLRAAPRHVVLSSCDIGRAAVRSGDELVGFTAALLYSGTSTVVAGVARLPDDASTAGVMARYHRLIYGGTAPARALAEAVASESFMPLVCFGSG